MRADRELDRRVGDAHIGQPGDRFAHAGVRRDNAGRGVQHRRQTRPQRRRRADAGGLPGGRGAGAAMARRQSARRRTAAGVLQRRRRPAGGRGQGRRRGDLAAGRHALGACRPGRRRRRRTQRPHPLRSGGPARAATGPHRSRSDVGGVAHRQRARRAAGRARRIRHPRHRPHPDRIPADPHRTRHLSVLRRLRRPHRRRRRRRGTQGTAPSLCGCAIPGFLADGRGRRGGATTGGRGVTLAGAAAGRQTGAGQESGSGGFGR